MWFRPASRKQANKCRLSLESLESRCAPAVDFIFAVDIDGNDIVRIVSNKASDFIFIDDNGGTIDVTVNDEAPVTLPAVGTVDIVEVLLGGGHDQLFIEMNDLDGLSRSYLINTGRGNDLVSIFHDDITEGGADIQYQIFDGGGNDVFEFFCDNEIGAGSSVRITALFGDGRDAASFTFDDGDGDDAIASGASVHLNIDMGGGHDIFGLVINDDIDQAALDVGVHTHSGNDLVGVIFEDSIREFGNVTFNAYLGNGNDRFNATFDNDGFDVNPDGGADGAAVNISVWGEKGNDTLLATQTTDNDDSITINATVFDIHFYGGAGKDNITVDFSFQGDSFDGVGAIVVLVDGGDGDDRITARLSTNGDSDNVFDVTLLGGAGKDFVTFRGDDAGGFPNFVGGWIILDGGFGRDTKSVSGDYPVFDVNFEFAV